jgi:asparagine synthase (glutamine-hydrolysing)
VLLTQPLVETCVRVDSRLWFAPGQTRALARHAFAAELPPVTLARRSKGTPDGFVATLFLQRRPQIRAMLLDGLLAEQGLLNRAAIAQVLDARRPVANTDFVRMMELVDAEAWARCWV